MLPGAQVADGADGPRLEYWEPRQTENCQLFDVPAGSREWRNLLSTFHKSLPTSKFTVVRLQRACLRCFGLRKTLFAAVTSCAALQASKTRYKRQDTCESGKSWRH